MSVARKLKCAFERRSDEIDEILESMPLFHGPIIMCGDFNDTPMSFTYRQMQKAGFVDSFTKVGRGIKPTYAGKLPLMRIDYIWGNDKVKPLKFKRFRYKASDHYPIMLDFSIQQ
jgi:endonuclease/exonuclease/phosphatase (EEP) superfamily protein YafD